MWSTGEKKKKKSMSTVHGQSPKVVFLAGKSRRIEGLNLLLKGRSRAFHGKLTEEKFCHTLFRRYASNVVWQQKTWNLVWLLTNPKLWIVKLRGIYYIFKESQYFCIGRIIHKELRHVYVQAVQCRICNNLCKWCPQE